MELAATYDRPLAGDVRLQLYGGPVGEPALGPTAFPHRISARPNPLAPITHHWVDSTHITYGVITGGVYGKRWKAETSVFNRREPVSDELFTVAKLQAGYTRYLSDWRDFKPGVGAQISAGIVPESLKPFYGSRFNLGFGIFLTVRPRSSGI